jgi:exonuclease III
LKGWLSRYAPDIDYLSTEEAEKLPHNKQDYLLLVNRKEGPPAYLNGEKSDDFSVFMNHSWRKDNVELDEEGDIFIKKDITKATEARPVELLLNYGYHYWWDKILRQSLNGEMTTGKKRWLEVIVPDDFHSLSYKDKKTYADWHEHRKAPYYIQKVPLQKISLPDTPTPTSCADHVSNMPEAAWGGSRRLQSMIVENKQCFPTFKRVTLNITSFGPLHDPTKGRLSRVLKTVNSLLRSHDLVYLQETRLTSQDQINILRTYFEGCILIGSVSVASPAQAGVLIIIKNTVMQHYDIKSTYCSTTPLGMGRVVSVAFTPKTEHANHLFSFRETCLYLKSGTGRGDSLVSPQDERQTVVQELCGLPRDTHLSFLGGDINQHDNKTLCPFLDVCDMEEVEQDINTFYRMEKEKVTSTRIDRWYCNISAAQNTVINPTSRVLPNITGTVGRYCSGKLKTIDYIPTANTKGALPTGHGRRGECL